MSTDILRFFGPLFDENIYLKWLNIERKSTTIMNFCMLVVCIVYQLDTANLIGVGIRRYITILLRCCAVANAMAVAIAVQIRISLTPPATPATCQRPPHRHRAAPPAHHCTEKMLWLAAQADGRLAPFLLGKARTPPTSQGQTVRGHYCPENRPRRHPGTLATGVQL
jgi:hypothetical protein